MAHRRGGSGGGGGGIPWNGGAQLDTAHVRAAGNVFIPVNAGYSVISFNTNDWDTNGLHVGATPFITIVRAGYYIIGGSIAFQMDVLTSFAGMQIRRNSSVVQPAYVAQEALTPAVGLATEITLSTSYEQLLAPGDTVSLWGAGANTGGVNHIGLPTATFLWVQQTRNL